jgi:hypothetical protein
VLTVETGSAVVESRLLAGEYVCPCGGVLGPWGWARRRKLRDLDGVLKVRPRRGRCRVCLVTHVLLLVDALLRRADTAAVIGSALADKAAGVGYRKIAARLGRSPSTVRRWLCRFGSRAEAVRSTFTALAVRLAVGSLLPGPQASGFADAVAAIGAAASAAAHRFGVLIVSGWRLASTVSSGRLLAPNWSQDQSTRADAWADLLR